ncbi:MAG: flagellar hook capping protein [candidate division Zixibacteria bacterium]|nr:flagellar hook capping protein [candidate division Zixibacteria bacterium]
METINSIGINNPGAGWEAASAGLTANNQLMGKEDFLQLLVAQLSNQDPLEPMQDTEFVSQLAQFSSLEQLHNLNDNVAGNSELDYLLSQTISNSMATQLIGKEVVAVGNVIELDSENDPTIGFKLQGAAQEVTISIYDSDGSLVRTITESDFDSGINQIEWDGEDSNGNQLSDGSYTFSVSAEDTSGASVVATPLRIGKVESVSYNAGAAYLMINGQRITLGDIIEVREG